MEPYDAMYRKLFNTVTDVERQLSEAAEHLRVVQQECEELFLSAPEAPAPSPALKE